MAQEFAVILTCDGCNHMHGNRTTDDVTTIGLRHTKLELDLCPSCREAFRPFLETVAKYGRVPEDVQRRQAGKAGRTPGPARAPEQQSLAVAGPATAALAAGQDWRFVPIPEDLICRTCDPPTGPYQTQRHFGQHRLAQHPEELRVCVVCGFRIGTPYNHYLRRHPGLPRPSGAWKGEPEE